MVTLGYRFTLLFVTTEIFSLTTCLFFHACGVLMLPSSSISNTFFVFRIVFLYMLDHPSILFSFWCLFLYSCTIFSAMYRTLITLASMITCLLYLLFRYLGHFLLSFEVRLRSIGIVDLRHDLNRTDYFFSVTSLRHSANSLTQFGTDLPPFILVPFALYPFQHELAPTFLRACFMLPSTLSVLG